MTMKLYNFFLTTIIFSSCASFSLEGVPREVYESLMNPDGITFIGTNYCGPGSTAENYDDLGSAAETDACCRAHDFAPDIMLAGESKNGLTNDASYTRLRCNADAAFKQCLKNVNNLLEIVLADAIGYIYFDLLNSRCYSFEKAVIGCLDSESNSGSCEEHEFDENSVATWQWFGLPSY